MQHTVASSYLLDDMRTRTRSTNAPAYAFPHDVQYTWHSRPLLMTIDATDSVRL